MNTHIPAIDRVTRWLSAVTVVLYCAFILLPFFWIGITGFKRQIDVLMARLWFEPTMANFDKLLNAPDATFLHNLFNSVVTSIVSTALVLAIAVISAHCLVHKKLPRWLPALLLGLTLLFHIVPPVTFIGSWYVMFRQVGLFDTLTGLVLAYTATNLPIGLWLGVNYAREVPKELLEAAELDCLAPGNNFAACFCR